MFLQGNDRIRYIGIRALAGLVGLGLRTCPGMALLSVRPDNTESPHQRVCFFGRLSGLEIPCP